MQNYINSLRKMNNSLLISDRGRISNAKRYIKKWKKLIFIILLREIYERKYLYKNNRIIRVKLIYTAEILITPAVKAIITINGRMVIPITLLVVNTIKI